MFTRGVEVDLEAYAKFIIEHSDIIHIASNLDAIGAGNEQLILRSAKGIRRHGRRSPAGAPCS